MKLAVSLALLKSEMILDVIFTYFQKEVCLYSQQLPDHLLLPSNKNYLKEKGTTMVWFSEKHMLCSFGSHYTLVLLIDWERVKELFCGPSQGCDFPLICSGNATHCLHLFIQLCEHRSCGSHGAELWSHSRMQETHGPC